MSSDKFSLKSRIGSFKFAIRGLWSLLKNEHNSRIHFFAAIAAITFAIVFKITPVEWSLLIVAIGIVFLTELLNTALETLSDIVNPEWDEGIRKVKDYAAAAVLIAAILSIVVGLIIFVPKLFNLSYS